MHKLDLKNKLEVRILWKTIYRLGHCNGEFNIIISMSMRRMVRG